jgi:KDO2-lipid IV(A) lauroyltransferase
MGYERAPLRWFFPPQPAKTFFRRIVRDVIGIGYVVGYYLLRWLPIDVVSLMGQEIWSRVGPHRYPDVDARVAATWKQLRPDATSTRQIDEAKLTRWRNLARVIGEYPVLDRLWPAGRIKVEGKQHLAGAHASGRPVIVMGLHLGNWEVIPPSLVGLGYPVMGTFQRPADRIDYWLLMRVRRRYAGVGDVFLQPEARSARASLRTLQQRRHILLTFADERINERVNAPAFGRALPEKGNIANIARLAAMTGALVVPAFAVRTGGAWFRLRFLPPVELGNNAEDNIAQLDAVIDPIIRANLDQWLMLFDFRFDR